MSQASHPIPVVPRNAATAFLPRGLSAYLDVLRLTAALAVFLRHMSWDRISGGFLWQFQFLGHDAVIIFFVLSGFVIPYAADIKEKNLRDYQIARLARLYSVVFPALILTYLFDQIGMARDVSSYFLARENQPLLRIVANLLFLGESWGWNLTALSNDAFWSLCYEFWYYQMFAACIYFRGRTRIGLVALAGLIAGPVILVYLPLWLTGVLAYRLYRRLVLPPPIAMALFLLSLASLGILLIADAKGLFARADIRYLPTGFSPVDYVLGLLMGVNIYAAGSLKLPFGALAQPIAAAAGITFTLYLFHLPILHLVSTYLPPGLSVPARGCLLMAATLLGVIVLSFVTERRKAQWRWFFRSLLDRKAPPARFKSAAGP